MIQSLPACLLYPVFKLLVKKHGGEKEINSIEAKITPQTANQAISSSVSEATIPEIHPETTGAEERLCSRPEYRAHCSARYMV